MSRNSAAATAEKTESPAETPQASRPRDLLSREDCLEIYRQLYLARYFDVRLIKEKKRGNLTGTLYSSHNQEAIIVGSLFGLKPTDWISPIHRDMSAFFLKDAKFRWRDANRMGLTIEQVCSQVWGKVTSPGRARDNWSHIGSREKRIIHSTSMLAGTIPVAAGVVYADRLNGGDAVCLTYNGEGSTAQGIFHEAINYAAVHKLPVVTIIENNQWAYGTPTQLEYSQRDFARRADGFGIPGIVADGQDVFDVYDKVMEAVEYARSGQGPSIVECKTFRAYGHGDHDDDRAARYRPPEEIEKGRSRDPIAVCRRQLLELGHLSEEEAAKYHAEGKNAAEASNDDFPPEVVEFLNEGIKFAIAADVPEAEEAALWVFKESGR
ncbi:thiamine pyrophosphate-dependent dehydrogenase E1 component subunit alpha [Fimbriimonas ginsengisoli]|uniref:Putative 2-oxoisovalerate dehydrogenase subunit alpha n=1 Tax=Fimbriimonas ginsengisoli Gsoil 348 TaxID=661478 RepID=A0A068NWG4_FIMGI|nr:thiamine pyrophosphate-dependent dehydrogenase E1 component subunit alpha [Fimbriimonas ginsengisoli]AIE87868.1 putative 2-oxoisovalerate dehydrogenase subunit alpha [Fimbriimonas ginsengisoli Gsoil 348]